MWGVLTQRPQRSHTVRGAWSHGLQFKAEVREAKLLHQFPERDPMVAW